MGNSNAKKIPNKDDFTKFYKGEWKSTLQIGDEVDYYDLQQKWKVFKITKLNYKTELGTLTLEREVKVIKNNKHSVEKEKITIDNWMKTVLIEPKNAYSTTQQQIEDTNNLHYHCKHGNNKFVKTLLEQKSIDINEYSDLYKATPLICALTFEQQKIAMILLENQSIHINTPRTSALYLCCKHGYKHIILKLMTFKEFKVDNQSLIYCASNGVEDILKYLLQSPNLDINATARYGQTALYHACDSNQLKCVDLLLSDNRIDVNVSNPFGIAVKKYHVDVIRRLLRYHQEIKDINLNIKTGYQCQIPLMHLCQKGAIELITLLLENNADVTIRDRKNDSALCYAIKKGHFAVVKLLLSHPNVNIFGNELYCAVEYDELDIFKLLLNPVGIRLKYSYINEVGAGIRHLKTDPNLSANDGFKQTTAMYVAAEKNRVEFMKLLIESGADIEKGFKYTNSEHMTPPLVPAVSGGHSLCVYYLLQNGVQVNNEIFCKAVKGGCVSCVQFIYERGADKIDIDYRGKHGVTPLMVAAKAGYGYNKSKNNFLNKNEIHLLVNGYVPYHVPRSIIFLVIEYFLIDGVVDLLIKYGANVLLTDKNNKTILSMAIEGATLFVHVDVIELIYNEIVKTKQHENMAAYINKVDKTQKTALLHACYHDRLEIGKLLIHKYGANIWQKVANGEYVYHGRGGECKLAEYIMDLMYNDKKHSNTHIRQEIDKTRKRIIKSREYSRNYQPKCFDGKGKVLMRDGSYKSIENVCIGDEVASFPNGFTTIKCIQISNLNRNIEMVYVNDSFWITFEHPILLNNNQTNILLTNNGNKYDALKYLGLGTNEIKQYGLKWYEPKELNQIQWKYQENVYNFVLNEYHTINVNGFWCITLGHDYKGKGIEHPFYGNAIEIDQWLRTSATYPVCVF